MTGGEKKTSSEEKGNYSSVTKQFIVSTQNVSAGNTNETVLLLFCFPVVVFCFLFCVLSVPYDGILR